MVRTHLSVEIEAKVLLRLNLWCKVSGITQKEAVTQLIKDHVPVYNLNVKVS